MHIADFYTAENWWWKYEWTAQNGNKYKYRVEVKEGESVDLQALFKEIHPNGTYQGWYKVFGDEGSKVDDVYTPNGTEETLYGKFGYVITFMSDGKVHQTLYTTTGVKGNQLENLGTNPENPGNYTFREWYTGENGSGTKITTSYQFGGNTTVYAKWVSVVIFNQIVKTVVKPETKEILKGNTIGSLPALEDFQTRWGFDGWTNNQVNSSEKPTSIINDAWVPTGNITLNAVWHMSLDIYRGSGNYWGTENIYYATNTDYFFFSINLEMNSGITNAWLNWHNGNERKVQIEEIGDRRGILLESLIGGVNEYGHAWIEFLYWKNIW